MTPTKKKVVKKALDKLHMTSPEMYIQQFAEAAVDKLMEADRARSKDKKSEKLDAAKDSLRNAAVFSETYLPAPLGSQVSMAERYAAMLVNKSLNDISLGKRPPIKTTIRAAQVAPKMLLNDFVQAERVLNGDAPYKNAPFSTQFRSTVQVPPVFASF
jgi:hypothetical protein